MKHLSYQIPTQNVQLFSDKNTFCLYFVVDAYLTALKSLEKVEMFSVKYGKDTKTEHNKLLLVEFDLVDTTIEKIIDEYFIEDLKAEKLSAKNGEN